MGLWQVFFHWSWLYQGFLKFLALASTPFQDPVENIWKHGKIIFGVWMGFKIQSSPTIIKTGRSISSVHIYISVHCAQNPPPRILFVNLAADFVEPVCQDCPECSRSKSWFGTLSMVRAARFTICEQLSILFVCDLGSLPAAKKPSYVLPIAGFSPTCHGLVLHCFLNLWWFWGGLHVGPF